jgi:hypothetical protein
MLVPFLYPEVVGTSLSHSMISLLIVTDIHPLYVILRVLINKTLVRKDLRMLPIIISCLGLATRVHI